MVVSAAEVVSFWHEAGPDRWFNKDAAFDKAIHERFFGTYEAAATGKLSDWEHSAQGALALLILLDQFPRNMAAVAVPLGALLAFLMVRTDVPGREYLEPLILIPIFVSAVVIAFGYVVAIGPVGIFSTLAHDTLGFVPWNLYSLLALILIAGLTHAGRAQAMRFCVCGSLRDQSRLVHRSHSATRH